MEAPDYLTAHADSHYSHLLPRLEIDAAWFTEALGQSLANGAHCADRVAELVATGGGIIASRKDYFALGAFNGSERSRALDLLGFAYQAVLPSFSMQPAFYETRAVDIRYAAARAGNRAMAAFCNSDKRLLGTALLPLDDPAASLLEVDRLISLGLRSALIPHRHCGGKSPSHASFAPIWSRLAEAAIPILMHVGSIALPFMRARTTDNTVHLPPEHFDGGAQPRGMICRLPSRDIESFLASMILGGVFERHPRLQAGVMEMGAQWVPQMMTRLDVMADTLYRAGMGKPRRKPSEQICAQLAFTPSHFENVGDLCDASDSGLFLFSSDYPHLEGGPDPIGAFENSLSGRSESERSRFYAGNFRRLFSLASGDS